MVNKVIVLGYVGKEPEHKKLAETSLTTFSVAVTEKWTDKTGAKKESTEWVNVSTFGRLAEVTKEYVHKGTLVYVEGKYNTRSYEDKNGTKKYVTGVVASTVQFLGKRTETTTTNKTTTTETDANDDYLNENDIPF